MEFVFKVYISCKPINHRSKSERDIVVAYQRSLCLIFQTLLIFSCQQRWHSIEGVGAGQFLPSINSFTSSPLSIPSVDLSIFHE